MAESPPKAREVKFYTENSWNEPDAEPPAYKTPEVQKPDEKIADKLPAKKSNKPAYKMPGIKIVRVHSRSSSRSSSPDTPQHVPEPRHPEDHPKQYPRGKLPINLPDEARKRLAEASMFRDAPSTGYSSNSNTPSGPRLYNQLAGTASCRGTTKSMCGPRNPYVAPRRRHENHPPPMTAPNSMSTVLSSKWAKNMSYAATVRSRCSTFGTQLESRLPSVTPHKFRPFDRKMITNVHRFELPPVLYMEKEVSRYINLGREGQGPACYTIGATVAARTFNSRKKNSASATFGNAPRFGYARYSKYPSWSNNEYSATVVHRFGPGPNRYDI
mmetsp:Transcript_38743/g.84286  ORF Transcript_38743/g.84286 Transcript_38743/m.84286 type:complete len:328 (-) Transcript_38743:301-1284(-)|eukprot:CAMPEP_0118942726 /NCGR_PEP_ID=MMETSP1169-20130426/36730_1 /TAXON_ID=36882 /ORGANISM="Pyramimonas obovata, Strain CCMP722" /LENGTH=327 /DNA_ID=CAMNT_0006887791 /DNA_START=232 /DNA_END=1215 /DNA_ORIENTATION=-